MNFYFLGIGGIGMSALARYFHALGKNVAGYDLTSSAITVDLEEIGIGVHFEDDVQQIPEEFKQQKDTLVIRTPAVPTKHSELNYFIREGFQVRKRSEVLGLLFNTQKGIAIAGTHGKTSVSSMAAFILSRSSLGCSAFLGGILKNTQSNLILNERSEFVVAEADEFDRSFLQLYPHIALVTWVDADHLDIYSSTEDIEKTFQQFLNQVQDEGTIILKKGIQLKVGNNSIEVLEYSLDDPNSDYYASNLRIENHRYEFDIHTPAGRIESVRMQIPGITNVENAVAAASVSHVAGVQLHEISEALNEFSGVKRRFDVQLETAKYVYIDDYAHHPRELDAVIGSVRRLYGDKKITGVFQPHLYSRTRDFAEEFAESLSNLDELVLMDIYPAREQAIEGVNSDLIFKSVQVSKKTLCSKSDLMGILEKKDVEVLLTMGAGDIDRFVEPIRKMIEAK